MISQAASDVLRERLRQDQKWGEQNHEPATWLDIAMEELGEAAQAMLHVDEQAIDPMHYRTEMVQLAAVVLAAVESFDRQMRRAEGEVSLWLAERDHGHEG